MKKENEAGVQQVLELIDELGLIDEPCINTGDSLYGSEACRKTAVSKKNLIQMFRLTNKRKLYRAPEYLKVQGPGRRKLFLVEGHVIRPPNPSNTQYRSDHSDDH